MVNKKLDLGQETMGKLFITYVIPAIISMIAMTTAGLIDSYFIGNFVGSEGIGAVTLVMPILNISSAIIAMIVSGGMVLAGIASGKKDKERSNNIFNVTFYMVIIISLILMLMIRLFGQKIVVDLMGMKGISARYVIDYLFVMNLFTPFFMLTFFFSFFLKLDGFPVTIVQVTLVGVMINIVMDLLFVKVLSLGMKGAAFATGLSQVIPCLIFLLVTFKKSNWKFKMPRFNLSDIKTIFFNGSSECLNLGSVGIAGYIYNLLIIRKLGTDGIAAYGIAIQVAGIATMVFTGISDGVQSIVSFNYGADKCRRVDQVRGLAFKYSGIFGFIFALIIIIFGENIAGFFVESNIIIRLTKEILIFYGMATIMAGINLNASTYYTAMGQPIKSAVIALMRSFLGLIVGLMIFPQIFKEYGIWIPIIFTEMITMALVMYYIKVTPYGKKI